MYASAEVESLIPGPGSVLVSLLVAYGVPAAVLVIIATIESIRQWLGLAESAWRIGGTVVGYITSTRSFATTATLLWISLITLASGTYVMIYAACTQLFAATVQIWKGSEVEYFWSEDFSLAFWPVILNVSTWNWLTILIVGILIVSVACMFYGTINEENFWPKAGGVLFVILAYASGLIAIIYIIATGFGTLVSIGSPQFLARGSITFLYIILLAANYAVIKLFEDVIS